MPMYWTFNCFLGCIYTVYHIVYIVFLVLNWLSNLEFWLPKKRTKLPKLGSGGGRVGDSGNARKKTFFFFIEAFPKRARQPSLLLFLRDDTWGRSVLPVSLILFFWRRMFHSLQNRGSQPKAIISLPHCFATYDQSLTFQFNLWHHSDLLPGK